MGVRGAGFRHTVGCLDGAVSTGTTLGCLQGSAGQRTRRNSPGLERTRGWARAAGLQEAPEDLCDSRLPASALIDT